MGYNLQDDLQRLYQAAKHKRDYEGERLYVFYRPDKLDVDDGSLLIPEHLSVFFDDRAILIGVFRDGKVTGRTSYDVNNGYHRILKAQLASALIDSVTGEP